MRHYPATGINTRSASNETPFHDCKYCTLNTVIIYCYAGQSAKSNSSDSKCCFVSINTSLSRTLWLLEYEHWKRQSAITGSDEVFTQSPQLERIWDIQIRISKNLWLQILVLSSGFLSVICIWLSQCRGNVTVKVSNRFKLPLIMASFVLQHFQVLPLTNIICS